MGGEGGSPLAPRRKLHVCDSIIVQPHFKAVSTNEAVTREPGHPACLGVSPVFTDPGAGLLITRVSKLLTCTLFLKQKDEE